ncbi:MAG: alkaline phosphatase family protein [Herpetosiphon sp.]
MLNTASFDAVDAAGWRNNWIKPLYGSYCFAHIPQTVEHLLTGSAPAGLPASVLTGLDQTYDTVILLFLDAFGWRFFAQYADHPFLRRIADTGVVSRLTSLFPSTTAAHVTAIHTGLPPAQSGVFEWFYYEPQVDAIIAPLLFSYAGDRERGTLLPSGIDPHALYPRQRLYTAFAQRGIPTHLLFDRSYADSPFTRIVGEGATVVPFTNLLDGLRQLVTLVQHNPRGYYFLYYDKIDALCHAGGPASPELHAEITSVLDTLETTLAAALAGKTPRALLLITADHGQTAISPATTLFLNRLDPHIGRFFKRNRAGKLLVPAGSSRDMFLYVEDEQLDAARDHLSHLLDGRADLLSTAELVAAGLFGPQPPSDTWWSRVGNLVILPFANESVWWHEKGRFGQPYHGMHGGLHRDEMETIFLAQPLS